MAEGVTEQEGDLAFGEVAPVVNKFYLHQTAFWVRISFAEMYRANSPHFRTALAMSPVDAHALADLIKELVPPPTAEQIAANAGVPSESEPKNV